MIFQFTGLSRARPRKDSFQCRIPTSQVTPPIVPGPRVEIFDTTLRDGTQSEHIAYSLADKLEIAHALDGLGVDYIEGGWPGSNPKDMGFFDAAAKDEEMGPRAHRARRLVRRATPRTRRKRDPNLQALVASGAPVLIIFGKTWDFHVTDALRVSLEDNLNMVASSVKYLSEHCFRRCSTTPSIFSTVTNTIRSMR